MRLTHFLKEGKGIRVVIGITLMCNVYVSGYLSGSDQNRPKLLIFEPKIMPSVEAKTGSESGEEKPTKSLVASKSGTKVYFVWCTGVSRIKAENKVYFDSLDEALKEGYKPAQNCPGM
ncbi:MAG: hypothetical protein WC087_03755 [Candidatus Paceibacterota bacterium]